MLTTALLINLLDAELRLRNQGGGGSFLGTGSLPLDTLVVLALGVVILLYGLLTLGFSSFAWALIVGGALWGSLNLLVKHWRKRKSGPSQALHRIRDRIASGRYDGQTLIQELHAIENRGILLPQPVYNLLRLASPHGTDANVDTENHLPPR